MDKKEFMATLSTMLDQYVETNQKELEIPNDKIILSADMFSKVVNIISYCESQNIIDPFLQDMFNDVKLNRTVLSKRESKQTQDKKVPKMDWANARFPEGTVDLLENLFPKLRIAEHSSR